MTALTAGACLFLVACAVDGGNAATDSATAPTGGGMADASVSPSAASPSASAPLAGTAPPELAGTWRRAYLGEPLFLTLDGNGYTVQAADGFGAGRIFVEGDQITFSNSNRCDGDPAGTYTWGLENDRVRFTLVGEDPCGRAAFLLRATFGRVDP